MAALLLLPLLLLPLLQSLPPLLLPLAEKHPACPHHRSLRPSLCQHLPPARRKRPAMLLLAARPH